MPHHTFSAIIIARLNNLNAEIAHLRAQRVASSYRGEKECPGCGKIIYLAQEGCWDCEQNYLQDLADEVYERSERYDPHPW